MFACAHFLPSLLCLKSTKSEIKTCKNFYFEPSTPWRVEISPFGRCFSSEGLLSCRGLFGLWQGEGWVSPWQGLSRCLHWLLGHEPYGSESSQTHVTSAVLCFLCGPFREATGTEVRDMHLETAVKLRFTSENNGDSNNLSPRVAVKMKCVRT